MNTDFSSYSSRTFVLKKKDGGVTIPFLKDQSQFEIMKEWFDDDIEEIEIGHFFKYQNLTLDKVIQKERKAVELEYEPIKEYLFSDDYLSKCKEVNDRLVFLEETCKKYRRKRRGNPDVDALCKFLKDHEFMIRCLRYDIAFSPLAIDREPTEEEKNRETPIVGVTTIYSVKPDASLSDRKEIASLVIDERIKDSNDDINKSFDVTKKTYNLIKKMAEDTKEDIYLVKVFYDTVKPLIDNSVIIKKKDFSIDDCAFLKANVLYILKK